MLFSRIVKQFGKITINNSKEIRVQFKNGTNVYTANGEKAGEIQRVVVDPAQGSVSHIVVRKGFLFTEDRVIPIDLIDRQDEDKIHLKIGEERLEELPEFIETNFVALEDDVTGIHQSQRASAASQLYWYPPAGMTPMSYGMGYQGYTHPMGMGSDPYQVREDKNIPEGTVALKEGANVIDKDGESVGEVSQLLTEPEENQVTHLVITKGLFNQEKKLIPANWISRVKEDTVQLHVNNKIVEKLKDYEE
jgi:sporulation protein YlmC with PRC-barrel domain